MAVGLAAAVAPAGEAPVAFMDTGPAAALGALHDERVRGERDTAVLNLGNMHLLGFRLQGRRIVSLYEHHTGEVDADQIVRFTERLCDGSLTNAEVFESKGHGAFHVLAGQASARPEMTVVTGPQRGKIAGTALRPYFAAPYGDMMAGGCFGLLRAFAEVYPEARHAIEHRLGGLPE